MKLLKIFLVFSTTVLLFSSIAVAGDFDWIHDLNIRAQADPSGFRAMLGSRFKIGDVEIDMVLSNVKNPGDAYMVLRLGEMSRLPGDYVIDRYRNNKNNGWGPLAKRLGIKPGSEEFRALKNGHDLYDNRDKSCLKQKGKNKEKNKGKKNNQLTSLLELVVYQIYL